MQSKGPHEWCCLQDPSQVEVCWHPVGTIISHSWQHSSRHCRKTTCMPWFVSPSILCLGETRPQSIHLECNNWCVKNTRSGPYTWNVIIDALRTPGVGEVALADELDAWHFKSTQSTTPPQSIDHSLSLLGGWFRSYKMHLHACDCEGSVSFPVNVCIIIRWHVAFEHCSHFPIYYAIISWCLFSIHFGHWEKRKADNRVWLDTW